MRTRLSQAEVDDDIGRGGCTGNLSVVRRAFPALAPTLLLAALMLPGCAALVGYPKDPENTTDVLKSLKPYFDPKNEAAYSAEPDSTKRRAMRDTIVLNRVRTYDIDFAQYEKSLWSSGNSVTIGGDLVALALGGLATTVASTSAKTGYAAANTGVVGAGAAINRDLFFQRTLPALLAQMEANRARVKLKILAGIKQSDDQYSLPLADLDLGDLKSAGSMPAAVSNITQQATNDKQAAETKIDALRTGTLSSTSTTTRLRAWVSPNGQVDPTKMKALQDWMNADPIDADLHGIPPEVLIDLDNPQMEADRARAISALNVP
jgi:hypothetical protein